MFVTELDTFVLKFHQLWKAGHTAHLDLDTCAGKAWVGLRVQLGQVPGPPYHELHPTFVKKKDTPSRQRRRARRAAAQQMKVAEEASNRETLEESVEEAENPDKALSEESRVAKTPERVEETKDKNDQEVGEEVIAVEVVEETYDARQIDGAEKVESDEMALKEVVDEICPDVDYEAKPTEVVKVKSQYPRHCEDCNKYLRNNTDFRKHVVPCMMSRK